MSSSPTGHQLRTTGLELLPNKEERITYTTHDVGSGQVVRDWSWGLSLALANHIVHGTKW